MISGNGLSSQKLWTFNVFIDHRKTDVIREWFESCSMPVKARVKLDTLIRHLEATPKNQWHPSQFKPLQGYSGIFEIRTTHKNVQYRPLGCFGPKEKQFTLLIGAIEKDWKFIPRTAPETAVSRCDAIHKGENLVDEY